MHCALKKGFPMNNIKFYKQQVPLEMHKVRVVQKINLVPINDRLAAITEAGNNTFLLKNKDIFLDMLTDSGVNAMSDMQQASMMLADDSYAGSGTFVKLEAKIKEIFGMEYFLPMHQGRACEHLLSKVLVKEGSVVPMNYHFTTTKAHIGILGGSIEELFLDDALKTVSDNPFKGNMPPDKLKAFLKRVGVKNIPFVRMEAGTNLIGGQPFSLANLREIFAICKQNKIPLVLDASLLADNLYFIKTRESEFKNKTIKEITKELAANCDVLYFSARKLGHARGGGVATHNKEIYLKLRELVPLYEGFLTYGGMSVREIEAITVGLDETMDYHMISQGPKFIEHMVAELVKNGVPVITPAGGLGCHLDAKAFCDHLPQTEYPAGALAAALYIISGVRGMERGTLSEERKKDGTDTLAHMELVRLALPRRVFTLSQISFVVDRILWLYKNRKLIGGLKFTDEPKILRFFLGKLVPKSNWQQKLVDKFKQDFGDSL